MRYTDFAASSPLPSLPALPRKARASRASLGLCLCGCGRSTGSRFAPGHDAKLQGWVLVVESGAMSEAPYPHTLPVAIEIELRAASGIAKLAHVPLLITPELVKSLAIGQVA